MVLLVADPSPFPVTPGTFSSCPQPLYSSISSSQIYPPALPSRPAEMVVVHAALCLFPTLPHTHTHTHTHTRLCFGYSSYLFSSLPLVRFFLVCTHPLPWGQNNYVHVIGAPQMFHEWLSEYQWILNTVILWYGNIFHATHKCNNVLFIGHLLSYKHCIRHLIWKNVYFFSFVCQKSKCSLLNTEKCIQSSEVLPKSLQW